MSLTKEEVSELTRRVNDRLNEFARGMNLTRGEVRICHEVIILWHEEQMAEKDGDEEEAEEKVDVELLQDVFHAGYQRGLQAAALSLPDDPQNVSDGPVEGEDVELHTPAQPDNSVAKNEPEIVQPPSNDDPPGRLLGANGNGHYPAEPVPPAKREMTDARRRQLDERKEERRRDREAREGKAQRKPSLPTRGEFLAEVKRQAMGGVIPTMKAFDEAKPVVWASAWAHMQRLGIKNWAEVAELCGLRMSRISREPEPVEQAG